MEAFVHENNKITNHFLFVSPSRGGVDDVLIVDGEVCKNSEVKKAVK